jgi:hypothetical protein
MKTSWRNAGQPANGSWRRSWITWTRLYEESRHKAGAAYGFILALMRVSISAPISQSVSQMADLGDTFDGHHNSSCITLQQRSHRHLNTRPGKGLE